MKFYAALVFASLLPVSLAFAQHSGSHGGGGEHHSGGFRSGSSEHRGGNSGSVGNHGGYTGNYGYGRSQTVIVPYAYPVFGYGLGYSGDPGYAGYTGDQGYTAPAPGPAPDDSANYAPVAQPAPPPPPDETVPQPDDSGIRMYQAPAYSQTPEEAAMSEGRYYLIAYKDHSIYTALAYWMENGALNYVTPQSAHNQVTLDLVDLDLTKQLNARRGISFNLVNR